MFILIIYKSANINKSFYITHKHEQLFVTKKDETVIIYRFSINNLRISKNIHSFAINK